MKGSSHWARLMFSSLPYICGTALVQKLTSQCVISVQFTEPLGYIVAVQQKAYFKFGEFSGRFFMIMNASDG
jgi:hypothetical protein